MNETKKIISLLLSLIMTLSVFSIIPFSAGAAETEAAETGATSGTSGDCKWTLDNGVLTISGNGKMEDYDYTKKYGSYVTTAPWGGYSFNTVVIESGITSIGNYAFYGCTGLTSVTIPDSVTSIGGNVFGGCTALASVTIPDSVTSIGYSAFEGCTGLTSVTIPDSVTSIDIAAFYNTAWYNNQPDGLIYAGKVAYEMKGTCPSDVVIKDGTLGIANSAFYGRAGLTSIDIPDSVTSIGISAFDGCTSLTSIDIPDSVTSIGGSAFAWCTGLTSVTIPDSVTSIGSYAFGECTRLTSVTIPDSVTSIGDYAFGFDIEYNKINGFVIYGYKDTEAERYAKNNGFTFKTDIGKCDNCQSALFECDYHKGSPATCVKDGLSDGYICPSCGHKSQTVIPATGHHTPGEPKQENLIKSTCTKEGSYDEVTYCTVCKAELSRTPKTIEKLAHTPVTDKAVPATCTKTGLTEGSHCSVCKTVLVEQTVIPVKDHTPGEPKQENLIRSTCTKEGSYDEVTYCTVCKAELSRTPKTIEKLPHTPVTDKAVPATCTETGLTEGSHCSVCKTVLVEQTVVPALGHKPIIDKAVPATCQHDGHTTGSYCENCGEVYVQSQVIPKLPHTPVRDEAVPATCTHTGLTEGYHCSECNEILTAQEITKALGHTYEAVPGKPATYLHTGLTDGVKCSRCGEWLIEQEVIPKLTGEGILGDIDGDGEVSVLDATYIQRYATRVKVPFTDEQMLIGDVDDDGELNVLDATYIQRYSTRVKVPYPVGQTI